MKRIEFLWKYERYFFALFVFFTAVPVLFNTYFPTVDGPAHLHNANLLKHLWFLNNDFPRDFFDFNKHLNSNFLDHLWFALFGLFLPVSLVEKSILLFYVLSLPYSFRFLVKRLVADERSARLSSYLIFSFVYSFTFRIGFFNFCVGIPVLFWTLGLWIKNRDQLSTGKIFLLASLSTIVYLSHIFNFMLLGIIIFVNEIQYALYFRKIRQAFKQFLFPTLIVLPGLILSVLFVVSNSSFKHSPPTYLSSDRLLQTIIDLSPVITLNYDSEVGFAHIILYTLCVLLLMVIIDFFRKRKQALHFRPYWLVSSLIVLLLFFVFPDWIASGGFISIRWALFFFLMLIVLIAAKGLPPNQLFLPVAVLLTTHVFFVSYHNERTKILSDDAATLVRAEEFMEDNTVLLPLNYSNNWIQINHACYMATQKNIVSLDNYEPTKPHFPLIWKQGEQVYDLMPKYGNRNPPCIDIDNYERATHHKIDYLSRFCFNGDTKDSCTALIELELKKRFELIYLSENKKMELYKRKQ